MSAHPRNPGGAAVGRLDELPPLERRVIRCLRLWCAGEAGQQALGEELARRHGPDSARRIAAALISLAWAKAVVSPLIPLRPKPASVLKSAVFSRPSSKPKLSDAVYCRYSSP